MRKILLTSAGFENPNVGQKFIDLLEKPAANAKVMFIPTAANCPEAICMLDKCKEELYSVGIKPENLFDYNLDYNLAIEDALKFDAIYFAGGDPTYLLSRIKEINFDVTINKLLAAGRVYVGVSAGSVVAAPENIYSEDESICNKALNLVNCYMHVHCEEGNIQPKDENSFIVWLTDKQAILSTGSTLQIIQ